MERRKLIILAAVGAATVAIPSWYYSNSVPDYDPSLAQPLLLSSIWDSETIAEIGKRYQKQYPKENSERKLVKLLSESTPTDKDPITASIEWRTKEDYKTGNIVTIDGWILSETEGRQCALFSLIQSK